MYQLYKKQFKVGLFQVTAGVLLLFVINSFIYYYREAVGIAGTVICMALWSALCVLIIHVGYSKCKASPYRNLKMRCQQEPGLEQQLLREFAQAENVDDKVWLGETYVFFKEEYEFKVFPRARLYDLAHRELSIPRGGNLYILTGKCDGSGFTVSMSSKGAAYVYQKLGKTGKPFSPISHTNP